MHGSRLPVAGRGLPLLCALLLLVACGSGPASQATRTPTLAPLPSVPAVTSTAVQFSTSDHITLAGQLFGQGTTAVVCSHMLNTTQQIWINTGLPQRLAQRGYLVLTYDFRGTGQSQGQYNPSMNALDLSAAVNFVRQQGATRLVLLGASMGGTASLKVAASMPVAAVVTLSAPLNYGVAITNQDLQGMGGAKLFINSQGDAYATDTTFMFGEVRSPKELHLYDGEAHGTEIFTTDDTDLTWRILAFLAHYAPAQ